MNWVFILCRVMLSLHFTALYMQGCKATVSTIPIWEKSRVTVLTVQAGTLFPPQGSSQEPRAHAPLAAEGGGCENWGAGFHCVSTEGLYELL